MSGEQAAFEASSFEHNDVPAAVAVHTRGVGVWPDVTNEVLAIRRQTDALGGFLVFDLRSQP